MPAHILTVRQQDRGHRVVVLSAVVSSPMIPRLLAATEVDPVGLYAVFVDDVLWATTSGADLASAISALLVERAA
ncbi:hypothetical protein [Acidipropionibacterium acidipropionici]|uniref:hypothetical protein n=1 Tax=Acidipropionibacterium acidipropionici TaxID=1748 RepID=UPI0003FF07B3|nr:hypothetical protein [Acidipropionibacterium acidipropionici]ALN14376.1 hypothetical protein ASQ49_02795 [Acidipropionibacterium acidipropionici]APZ09863.1 hypothetical protein BWX38_12155 [Acidipropionibacterium acidipropionici]